jgi:hypothetical protein
VGWAQRAEAGANIVVWAGTASDWGLAYCSKAIGSQCRCLLWLYTSRTDGPVPGGVIYFFYQHAETSFRYNHELIEH